MKLFKVVYCRHIFKRWLFTVATMFLFLAAASLVFVVSRTIVSAVQGYKEMEAINQEGNYVAQLQTIDGDFGNEEGYQKVFYYLEDNLDYALYTDGFIVELSNNYDMESIVGFFNEEYYNNFMQLEFIEGGEIYFDHQSIEEEIPVFIGAGLGETYPVGSIIEMVGIVQDQSLTLKVQGIIEQDAYYSNFYLLSSKSYYNFSILIPVNGALIEQIGWDLQVNALDTIVLPQATEEEVSDLREYIWETLELEYAFNTQEENNEFFEEYYLPTLMMFIIFVAVMTIVMIGLSIWNTMSSIRLMIKDLTINVLVGLSYAKLKRFLYTYYGVLFSIITVIVYAVVAYGRHYEWIRKNPWFTTYGFLGLIEMDWIGLLTVIVFSVLMGVVIVETMMWRIKRVPISLGVLQ